MPLHQRRVATPLKSGDGGPDFMPGPFSENPPRSRIASSPISKAFSPARAYAAAPDWPAPMTAMLRPEARAWARHRPIAASQASGSPTGLPLARLIEPKAR